MKVRYPQYRELISQIYFEGGDYLESDVANAVRKSLVAPLIRRDDLKELADWGFRKPYFEVRYDFVLVPRQSDGSRRRA